MSNYDRWLALIQQARDKITATQASEKIAEVQQNLVEVQQILAHLNSIMLGSQMFDQMRATELYCPCSNKL